MRQILLRITLLSACLTVLPAAFAQKKPKENADTLVAIRPTGMDVPTNGLLYFHLWEVGGGDVINTNCAGAGTGGTLTQLGVRYALMTPGRHYQATLSADPWSYGEVKFSAPPGYSIWINDSPISTFRVLGNPFLIFKIEVRPDNDAGYLPAGESAMPHVGDLIWGVSAGRYSNGLSAGNLQWRTDTLSADLLNATSLHYMQPNTGEVTTTWHSDGGVTEIWTTQMRLYVKRNATSGTGYDIEIRSPYASRTDSNGNDGPFTYDEVPIRTYRVSNPDGGTWSNRIKIEKIDSVQTLSWTLHQSGSDWSVIESTALRTTTLTSSVSGGVRTETVLVQDNASNAATKLQRTFQNFGWGQEEMTQQIANPDATNGPALTTTYTYNTTYGTGGYGRLDSVTNPDGSWTRYVYDDSSAGFGNLTAVYRPWQDSPSTASSANSANCNATLYSYAGERNVFLDLSAGTETRINGTTTAKNTTSYSWPGNAPNGQPLRTETVQTYTAAGGTLTTTRNVFNPSTAASSYIGRLHSQTNPDGTKVSALRYQAYWWNYGDSNATNLHLTTPGYNNTWGEYRFNGFGTAVTDSVAVYSWDGKTFDTVYMVPNRSTVDLDVYNDQGRVQDHVHYVFTGATSGVASFEFIGLEEDGYSNGRLIAHTALNGLRESYAWIYNRLSGQETNDGVYTENTPDAIGRPTLSRKWYIDASGEYAWQGYISTHRTFDASDRVLTEKVSSDTNPAGNPADAVTTTRVYNLAGLLTSETAESTAGAFQTTYAYSNGGRTVTTTFPGGATKITDNYLDGSPKSVTGTGVVAQYTTATVNSDGTITNQTTTATSGGSRWTKVTTDWVGRKVKEEHPTTTSGTTFAKQYYYNSVGQLIKTTETGLADTLTAYNAWQQPYRTGLDLSANGTLDLASLDRITETDTLFEKNSGTGAWWTKTTTLSYNVDNSGTPVTTGVTKQRLNKFDDHGRYFGSYVQSESASIDLFGNQTTKIVAVQRGSSYFANDMRLVTETTTYPDSTTSEVKVTRNGLVQKQQSKQGLVTRFYYDARGRLVKQTNPRTDTSTTARTGYVTNSDRVAWRQDTAGNQTNYAYDSSTGQLFSETNPLSKAVYHGYDYVGREVRTWGAATYPVEYAFNDYGEKTAMRTFRTATDFTMSTWPLSDDTDPKNPNPTSWTSGDKTTWAYDTATGLLLSKTDAGTASQAPQTVSYAYNARGQLARRTWSRGTVTTYAYSSTTAEQTGIDYSDSTPDITYTYNRLGQSATVGDVTGTRTFAYSATTTQLSSETLPSFFGSRVLSRAYDTTTTGALGRSTGFTLSGASGSGTDYSVAYGYDTYGRFNALTSGFGPAYTYAYTANSNLIGSVADTASGWTETMTYNSSRDLLDRVDGQFSTAHKATFAYTYDNLGRRTARTNSGEIFDRYNNSGLTTNWTYDDKSQVTAEQSVFAGTSTAVAGRDDAFAYDSIGNRSTATRNGHTATYTANELNQYTQRTVPGYIGVSGLAPASGTVTVNGSSSGVTQQGDYYFKDFSVTNTTYAAWQSFTIASSLGGSFNRTAFIPATPESMSYDLDGNLLSDGRWDYTWDAENRLIAMQTHTALSPSIIANADARRLEFTYDYLGRRVEKLVRSGYNGSTYTAVTLDRKFIFDGWNLISERNGSTLAAVNSYAWGLDLTGTLQDGGGVGGLLAVIDAATSTVHQPYYDGNGNVHALVNRSTGAVTAAYEYSAFGETLRATGSFAQGNPFRFSSKYTDDETGLLYYGRRYYSPSQGRWLGRDPIEEKGGLHLYAFCGNNGINMWDLLGMVLATEGGNSNSNSSEGSLLDLLWGWITGGGSGSSSSGSGSGGGGGSISTNFPTTDKPLPWITFGGETPVEGGSLPPFVTIESKLKPPSTSVTIGGLTPSEFVSSSLSGAAVGFKNYFAGLAGSTLDAATGLAHAIVHPIATVTGIANAGGTAAGTLIYFPGAIATSVSTTVSNAINTPDGAAGASRAIGNLTGMVLIGAATSSFRVGPDFVGPLTQSQARYSSITNVGQAGRSATTRLVDSQADLEALFQRVSQGASSETTVTARNGAATWTEYGFGDGSTVSLRPFSSPKSGGGPTIQYKAPDGSIYKVHIGGRG